MFARKTRLSIRALTIGTAIALTALGGAPAATAAPVGHNNGWHFAKPYRIPHLRDAVNGLSCPTAKLCVAASSNRVFWTTNATGGKKTWKNAALEPLQQPGVVGGSVILDDVSCASAHLCAAVDNIGNAFVTSDPTGGKTRWQAVRISSIELLAVGCSSTGSCATVDDNGAVYSTTHPAGTWTRGDVALPSAASFYGVSCAGQSMCAAVGGSSKIATTVGPGGTHWTLTNARGGGWDDIACPTTSRCVAVGGYPSGGKVAVSKHAAKGGWKHAKLGRGGASKIDCASAASCFVLSDYVSSHPAAKQSAWHSVTVPGVGSQTGVSCPDPKRCYIGTSTNQFTVGRR
jgi:hypothetical protein